MFDRRLRLLAAAMAAVALVLTGQLARLTVAQGAERRAEAERRLDLVALLPTERGRILDREGRELAANRPGYDVAVSYRAITGSWVLEQARARARSERRDWAALRPRERQALVAGHVPEFEARLEQVWDAVRRLGGIDQAELDRRLDGIKRDVQARAAVVWDRQLYRQQIRYGDARDFEPRPIREQRMAHVVLPRVADDVAFAFRHLQEQYPDVIEVQRSHERVYPWENVEVTLDRTTLPPPLRSEKPITITLHGVADHLLGSMRDETWAGDIERRPLRDQVSGSIVDRGGYVPGDAVGARGLERAFEDHLRGLRGVVHERLDTGERTRTPHVPGQDLVLTIDIALQARVHATLSPEYGLAVVQPWQAPWNSDGSPRPTILPLGTALPAAAAVVDVETGQILALVSTPTIAESQRLPPCRREGYAGIVNRALEAIYPPGSIIKPLVLAAAVTEGAHGLDEPVECRGHYLPDREDVLRCWVYRPPRTDAHGEVRAAEALARSCNVYFYTLADHLGFERLVHWYERFGLGRPIDVGLGLPIEDESAWRGRLPRTGPGADVAATYGSLRFATVSMGIGQGPVTWTVLHAAAAYATLARFGDPLRLTLLRDDPRGTTSAEIDVGPLDERLVRTILEGLRQSVAAEHGTGHHIRYPGGRVEPILNVPGVTVWAKTGTAEAPPPALDLDCDGRPDPPRDDPAHAWFVGLVGAAAPGAGDEAARDARSEERAVPRYAIAVLVEHGGSGGRTAGPIANEIIRALVAEGYLPGDRP